MVEQKQCFCNPPCRDNVLQGTIVDIVWICEVSSKSFLLLVKDGPIGVVRNLGQLKPNLQQNVILNWEYPFQQRCVASMTMGWYKLILHVRFEVWV
jgi:hypothetical protein